MKKILFLLLLCPLWGCYSVSTSVFAENRGGCPCIIDRAIETADLFIKKKGYKTDSLYKRITEKDTFFLIYYYPKRESRGGDVDVKVSKETCEIIEIMRYQ